LQKAAVDGLYATPGQKEGKGGREKGKGFTIFQKRSNI
jgi:hypothetical protein